MRVIPTLLSSLTLPVVSGFQVLAMPPIANAASMTMSLSTKSNSNSNTLRKRNNAATPLNYVDGSSEDLTASLNGANAAALQINGGATPAAAPTTTTNATNDAIKYLAKAIPLLSIATFLATLLTKYLSNFSSPAAQGIKLVYAGAIAGIISRTFCAPIEMVSTVMMCRGDECSTMTDELSKTWKKEGFRGMFKGNGANCLKVAPSRGTQFLVYEFVKRKMLLAGVGLAVGAQAGSLHAGARLFAGGVAGMVAAAIVYPLEVVKTMLTLYPDRCKSIPDALSMVYKSSGFKGLYRGLGPTLVAMFPYVGVEFMVYETLKNRWEMYIGPVGTMALLLLGAAGGAAAQASAHPLDVIRRRMQMQSLNAGSSKKDDDGKEETKRYKNMFAGLYSVGKNEGLHVLFKGLGPACFEKIPSTAIGYFIYEFLKVSLKVSSV
jgi:solute carrier family 25 phosphate transporter 23/24/25/41